MRLFVSCFLLSLVTALLAPISASAQTDVDCVALVDSDGTRIARASPSGNHSRGTFFIGHNGFAVPFEFTSQDILGTDWQVAFTDTTCSSTPYVRWNGDPLSANSVVIGQDVYYSNPFSVQQSIQALSFRDQGTEICETFNQPRDAAPAVQFTIPEYTTPFHLEPEACYTPDPSVAALTPYSLGAMALVLAFGAYVMRKRRIATDIAAGNYHSCDNG